MWIEPSRNKHPAVVMDPGSARRRRYTTPGLGRDHVGVYGATESRSASTSTVHEGLVVKIDRRDLIFLRPVVLAVLPFGLVAALGQEMHVAHHVAGIEI